MNEADNTESHPLRRLEKEGGLADPGMSILVARSGVGKSAALINFALDLLMHAQPVPHVTAGMPSEKTYQYYKRIYSDFTRHFPVDEKRTWDDVDHNFIVISYLEPKNMIDDLEREIGTVITSAKLEPALIIVDGLEINDQTSETLNAIQRAATAHDTRILASVRIHRDTNGHVDLESPLQLVSSHTEHIYFLEPEPARDRIKVDKVDINGSLHAMPIYFCPHDFVFRNG